LQTFIGIAGVAIAAQATAQVTFYEEEGLHGRSFHSNGPISNLDPLGFNDRASSAMVEGGSWQMCDDAGFSGRCVVLAPGRYDSLAQMGLDRRISSLRPVNGNADSGHERRAAVVAGDYHRRTDERLYEVPVTSVHAVLGPPEQQCWVERQQVERDSRSAPNVGGAIVGAVIGGVLGHQIGSGRGNDVATAGGAVAGAAIGANVGRDQQAYGRDVQRCANVSSNAQPAYWDVTYAFNGVLHRIQTTEPPGPTLLVNGEGEPRTG
jgi:uncharacterized protein YcfJ